MYKAPMDFVDLCYDLMHCFEKADAKFPVIIRNDDLFQRAVRTYINGGGKQDPKKAIEKIEFHQKIIFKPAGES